MKRHLIGVVIGAISLSILLGCGSSTGDNASVSKQPENTSEQTENATEQEMENTTEEVAEVADYDSRIEEGWDAINTGQYDKAKELFAEVISIDEDNIDANLGLIEVMKMTAYAEPYDYAKELSEKFPIDEFEKEKEYIKADGLYINYKYGYVTDAFAKEKSVQVIEYLENKIEKYANDREMIKDLWVSSLAKLYYIQEDFEKYLELQYKGQDVDEIEPYGDYESVVYGLRWNEEKEEYETFTLDRWWGYGSQDRLVSTYCDIHGRVVQENGTAPDGGTNLYEYSYDEEGRQVKYSGYWDAHDAANTHDTFVHNILWEEYKEDEHPNDPLFEKTEDRIFVLTRKAHSESYTMGQLMTSSDIDIVDIKDEYGKVLGDY